MSANRNRNLVFFLAIGAAIVFNYFSGTFNSGIRQSPMDDNAYRHLQLENGLEVMLISDVEADRAAASLDVNIGSLQDPKDRPGLAHFLEHMLFLGTKTYPEAGEYQKFIGQHGGSHNAFTAQEHTNYFFEIDPAQLKPALDRFSRFFYEPLFTEDYVQREKEAVNSEFRSKYKDDFRRVQYAVKAIMNPEHPASQFATGNLETLSDTDSSKVRDELLEFYDKYYSANIMTLAIYGPQSLDELESWVREQFTPIENRQAQRPVYDAELFADGTLPLDMKLKPVKDLLRLNMHFPMPESLSKYKSKPSHYLGHLIGHEGEGSLLAYLKEKGWAESLSAGLSSNTRSNSMFQISIALTAEGLKNTDTITEQTFAYINLIKEQGVDKWIFDELKQIDEMHFRFQEGRSPVSLVQQLTMNMHIYDVDDYLQGDYVWSDFDTDLLQTYLDRLVPENMLRVTSSQAFETDKTDPWFAAPYSTQPISPEFIAKLNEAKPLNGLAIPAPNPFIPEDVSLQDTTADTVPSVIKQENGLTLWHQQDMSFKGPQSSVYITMRTPLSQQSAKEQMLLDAWVSLLNDKLNTFSYPAQLAGQGFSLYNHMRGIGVRLYGYRDKQDVLLAQIIEEMKTYQPKQDKWDQTKQELQRAYQNNLLKKPYERSMSELSQFMLTPSFDEQALLDALMASNLEDLVSFQKAFWQELDVVVLGHGNISAAQLNTTGDLIRKSLLIETDAVKVARKQVTQLNAGQINQAVNAQHKDSSMTLYIQGTSEDLKERAKAGLLGQMMHAPYYTYMRTERQYGYVVFATPYPMLEQAGLAFIIQSPTAQSQHLLDETERFMQSFELQLLSMKEDAFTAHKQGLIQRLLEKPKNLREKTNRFWREIDRENTDFNTAESIAAEVEKLTKEEVHQYYEQNIMSPEARRLLLAYDQKGESNS